MRAKQSAAERRNRMRDKQNGGGRYAMGCICITATGSVFFRKTENKIMQGFIIF